MCRQTIVPTGLKTDYVIKNKAARFNKSPTFSLLLSKAFSVALQNGTDWGGRPSPGAGEADVQARRADCQVTEPLAPSTRLSSGV